MTLEVVFDCLVCAQTMYPQGGSPWDVGSRTSKTLVLIVL